MYSALASYDVGRFRRLGCTAVREGRGHGVSGGYDFRWFERIGCRTCLEFMMYGCSKSHDVRRFGGSGG
jgi:hypothetical protein